MKPTLVNIPSLGQIYIDPDGNQHCVGPNCGGKQGYWLCLSHKEMFPNQLQKDIHLSEGGEHQLGWICPIHGLEIP